MGYCFFTGEKLNSRCKMPE